MAVENAYIEIVEYLCEQKANINIQDKNGVRMCVMYKCRLVLLVLV